MANAESLVIATDGSCLTNPGFAGWAWFINENSWASGAITHGTNQVAELSAVLMALQDAPLDINVTILSDSQYAINCADKWVKSWRKNKWKTRSGDEVKNQNLIRPISERLSERASKDSTTMFEWVKGHSGHPLNEAADVRCGEAARLSRSGSEDGERFGPGFKTVQILSPTSALQVAVRQPESRPQGASLDLRDLGNWANR
jgi:ribonuclease HI